MCQCTFFLFSKDLRSWCSYSLRFCGFTVTQTLGVGKMWDKVRHSTRKATLAVYGYNTHFQKYMQLNCIPGFIKMKLLKWHVSSFSNNIKYKQNIFRVFSKRHLYTVPSLMLFKYLSIFFKGTE